MQTGDDGILRTGAIQNYTCDQPGRVSDLTVFDCWNITRYVNGLADDDKGYTAVIIQSTKGAKLFEKAKHNLIVYPADPKLLLENDTGK